MCIDTWDSFRPSYDSYDGLRELFKPERIDFNGKHTFARIPDWLVERKCQTVGCLSATRKIDYVHHNYDSPIYPFVQLGQKSNISRFVDLERGVEQEDRGTMCQVGYIGWGMGASSSGEALKGETCLLWKYDCYRLIHGGDPEHVSPFHFRSLLQPFLPAVWACLAASSCGLAYVYVLLGAHPTSAALLLLGAR